MAGPGKTGAAGPSNATTARLERGKRRPGRGKGRQQLSADGSAPTITPAAQNALSRTARTSSFCNRSVTHIGGSVRFDQAGHQSRCVSRRHQAGESPIAGYERGDGWARIAADAACRRWHRGRWAASRRRTARRPPGPAGPAPQPGENRIGRSARSISWHARCGPACRRGPSPQPSPVPLAASAACPPGPVPPPGTGCGQPRRPAPVRRAGGGDYRPAAVPNPGSGGPSRAGSRTRPQPGPHHLDPSSGARCPAPAAAARQWSTVVIAGRE